MTSKPVVLRVPITELPTLVERKSKQMALNDRPEPMSLPINDLSYPDILTQSMAMKSAPIIPPRIRGFTTATFSLVTSIIGTDLNLALPFMSIAFSKARFNSYKSSPYT